MAFVGISGPSFTGKTSLSQLLAQSLPIDSIVLPDFHEEVWNNLVSMEIFTAYQEITKDRDYLLVYIGKVIHHYKSMIEAYREYPGIVLLDGTHIDLLIYCMLQLWYHYPTKGLQEELIHTLLELKDEPSIIYMTVADDENFPLQVKGSRRYNTSFLRCRKTELYYYDIFRDLNNVVTLPTSTVAGCDYLIIEDLKYRHLL